MAQNVIPLTQAGADLHPGAAADHLFRVAVISLVNLTADPKMVTIHAVPSGGSAQDGNIVLKLQVPANDSVQIGRGMDFPEGTKIVGVAEDDDAVNGHVSGVSVEV